MRFAHAALVAALLAAPGADARAAAQPPPPRSPGPGPDAPASEGKVRLSEPRLVPVVPGDERPSRRLGAAVQVGYAAPWGDARTGEGLTAIVAAAVPIHVEATWALDLHDAIGAFFAYAPGRPGAAAPSCSGGFDCSAHDLRAGLLARHAFAPEAALRTSLALGLGWEQASLGVAGPAGKSGVAAHGIVALLELAAERRMGAGLRAGPYLALVAGELGQEKVDAPGAPGGWRDVRDRAVHGWLEIGARLSLGR